MRKILLLDTTLRDGEQTPGVNLNVWDKIELARELALMKVDIIEAGFPAASKGDFSAVKAVAQEVRGVTVAALCRAVTGDIQRAWEALRFAEDPLIHIVIATSERHMLHKLHMSKDDVLAAAEKAEALPRVSSSRR